MTLDSELIEDYVRRDNQAAFAALVQRHAALVYSTALRLVSGEVQLAEDVTQTVFIALAQKGDALSSHRSLAGWLHTATRFAAIEAIRREQRRRRREQAALSMNDPTENQPESEKLSALLDEALGRLRQNDREAILLRYLQQKSLREVGEQLGLNENAARMRVVRAMERLRSSLQRTGFTISSAALTTCLANASMVAVPASFQTVITTSALCAGAATAAHSLSPTILTLLTMTKFKTAFVGTALVATVGTSWFLQQKRIDDLHQKNLSLAAQIQNTVLPQSTSTSAENTDAKRLREEHQELLRLRGEVGLLRRELAEAKVNSKPASPQVNQQEESKMPDQQAVLATAGKWVQAVLSYAEAHNGQLPPHLSEAQTYLPPGTELDAATSEFEVVFFPGEISDVPNPNLTIILREKAPRQHPDGRLSKAYAFANGVSQLRFSKTNDFAAYEETWATIPKAQRLGAPAQKTKTDLD